MLYFAYGSNMNHEQMAERCRNAHFLRPARLKNYKFVYDCRPEKNAYANVVFSPASIVWGALWDVSEEDIIELDKYEGVKSGDYSRNQVDINGSKVWVYSRVATVPGEPTSRYRQMVKEGAYECGLPDEYIKKQIMK